MHLGIDDPPGPSLSRYLRSVVLDHATTEHRRAFHPTLHLSPIPATVGRVSCPLDRDEVWDDALLADVVAALLRRLELPPVTDPFLAWVTRTGGLDLHDVDLASLRALRVATAEAGTGTDFHFVVVNRKAWRDPVTGVGQEWKRLRDRRTVRHTPVS